MKSWYKSKTIWTSIIAGITGVMIAVAGEGVVSVEASGVILIAVETIHVVWRTLTNQSITT